MAGPTPEPSGLDDDLVEGPAMWSRERVVTGWAQLWNVPNMLTLLRILLIPVFWVLLMHDDGQDTTARVAATLLFVVAAITDYLDGYLARRQGLVTTFGKIADPLADKALTGVALIGLSVLGELWWIVTILIVAREVGVTLVRFVVLKHGVIPASRGGKAKTVFQMCGIILFLLPITPDQIVLTWARAIVMGVALVLTVVTGVDYMFRAYRTRRDSKELKAHRAQVRAERAELAAQDAGPQSAAGQPAAGPAAGPAGLEATGVEGSGSGATGVKGSGSGASGVEGSGVEEAGGGPSAPVDPPDSVPGPPPAA